MPHFDDLFIPISHAVAIVQACLSANQPKLIESAIRAKAVPDFAARAGVNPQQRSSAPGAKTMSDLERVVQNRFAEMRGVRPS